MKSIRDFQFEQAEQLYRRLLTNSGNTFDTDSLDLMKRDILFSTDRVPLCNRFRVTGYELLDLPGFNTELGLICADHNVLSQFFETLDESMDDLEFVSGIWSLYVQNNLSAIKNRLFYLYGDSFIGGLTRLLNPREIINTAQSNVTITSDNTITIPTLDTIPAETTFTMANISVNPKGNNVTLQSVGSLLNVLTRESAELYTITGTSRTRQEVSMTFAVKAEQKGVNSILVDFGVAADGTMVEIILDPSRSDAVSIYKGLMVNSKIQVPVTRTSITGLSVIVSRSQPSFHTVDGGVYQFSIRHIIFNKTRPVSTGQYVSTKIDIPDDISKARLVVNETIIGNGIIEHYYTTETDSENNPIGFVPIVANSTDEIVFGIYKPSVTFECNYDDGKAWNLKYESTAAGKLVRLNGADQISTNADYITISTGVTDAGKISCSANYDLLTGDIEMHRGVGDYLVRKQSRIREIRVAPQTYNVSANIISGWANLIPLQIVADIPVSSSMFRSSARDGNYNAIIIPYTIIAPEQVSIIASNGKEYKPFITNFETANGTTLIIFDYIFDRRFQFTLRCPLVLQEYCQNTGVVVTIDTTSIELEVESDILIYGKDFKLHPMTYEIELLKSGKYRTYADTPPVAISYLYTIKDALDVFVYETNVLVANDTDMVVIPFNADEISAGNFHKLNGESISLNTRCKLTKGWNTIITTQPYPNVNTAEIKETNQLTNKFSPAGIIIPDSITVIRPYQKGMRSVPFLSLYRMPQEDARKCFAYKDGYFYVAFIPDGIEKDIIESYTVGQIPNGAFITGKRPILTDEYENLGYTYMPEIIQVTLPVRRNANDNYLFLKSVLTQPDSGSVVSIDKLGLNLLKE